jgi:hypothetical protein
VYSLPSVKYRTRKQQFAIIENIKHLPPDVLTRLRFDVDLHLDSSDPDALSPYVPRFVSAIYKQLYEYTNVDPLDECRIVVQKKPAPTKAKSDYKHGFKVTVLDVLASKQQMLQVRNLMYDAFATWGDPTWLKAGMTLEELDVIDRRVYDSHGWLLYGSQKADQIAGGYTATNLWARLDEEDSISLTEWSYYETVKQLSIFCDEDVEEPTKLEWQKEVAPVVLTRSKPRVKRLRDDLLPSDVNSEIDSIIRKILKLNVNDVTSTVNPASRDEPEDGLITYRLTRSMPA